MSHKKTRRAYKAELENLDKDVIRIADQPYQNWFPKARAIRRRFILHIGPTNSGKTHDAIENMMHAKTGVYLAPLRLLALEVSDDLNTQYGIPCNVITGEERHLIDNATHDACTVEMINYNKHYDVAVIDEAQMISDEYRGGSWVSAILGVNADVIHICMSPVAKNAVVHLIELCNDDYTIINHERKTPLLMCNQVVDINYKKNVYKGDAIIAFSKKEVLRIALKMQSIGLKPSIIYGALPWSVRKNEAEKFRTGKTNVVVATDAIGMGLNLPVHRIVFTAVQKYDGERKRALKAEEIRQIAGRAGRYGIYNEGYVAVSSNNNHELSTISRTLKVSNVKNVKTIMIAPPVELLMNESHSLTELLMAWNRIDINALMESTVESFGTEDERVMFAKESTVNMIHAALWLQSCKNSMNLTRDEMIRICSVQFDYDNDDDMKDWMRLCNIYMNNGADSKNMQKAVEPCHIRSSMQTLDYYTDINKKLGLMYSFARSMNLNDDELDEAYEHARGMITDNMIRILAKGIPHANGYYNANNDGKLSLF